MSDKIERTLGVIAGWNKLTTQTPETDTTTASEHEFTLEDLFLQLKKLRNLFNPENLTYLEGLVSEHVNNFNNPHRTDLVQLNTSVIQELYKLWLSEGNAGTREEFLKILFQYVQIADLTTTLAGTAQDQVPSVKGVAAVISQHNLDPDAHSTILGTFFKGEELQYSPRMVLDPLCGLPVSVVVSRTTPMNVIDINGHLLSVPSNQLESDCTYGELTWPLFGDVTNQYLQSENFNDAYWTKDNTTIVSSTSIVDMYGSNPAQVLTETTTTNPVEHSITNATPISVTTDEVKCITYFVQPAGRTCIGISVPDTIVGNYPFIHFDLDNNIIFQNAAADTSRICGKMSHLPSGWVRIAIFIKSKITTTISPKLYLLDIIDGDFTYQGTAGLGIAIFGAQMSSGISDFPPYIKTTTTAATIGKTLVSFPLSSDWISDQNGTWVVEFSNVIPLALANPKELFSICAGTAQISIGGKFPATHNNSFYFQAYKNNNATLVNQIMQKNILDDFLVGIYAYSPFTHRAAIKGSNPIDITVSSPINQARNTLYLGTDRYGNNPFNGYLRRIMHYTYTCTANNMQFLLGA